MKIRNKTIVILEALFKGHRIKLNMCDLEYEFYWNEDRLVVDFERQVPGKASIPYPIGFPDLSLTSFVKMCNRKTNKEIIIINTNVSLTEFNKNRNGKRGRKL